MTTPSGAGVMLDLLASLIRRLPAVRGRGAFAQRLGAAVRASIAGKWQIPLVGGVLVEVPRGSEQGWIPAFTGRYEPWAMQLADRFFEKGTFVLDLGGCYGLFAVPLGRMASERDGEVVVFEPVAENLRWLRRNLAINGLDSVVHVHSVGLADAPGRADVRTEQDRGGNAAVLQGMVSPLAQDEVASIQLERLDHLNLAPEVKGLRCSFVKMDVEGFELFALRGAEQFVRRHRPVIFGEFNTKFMTDYGLGPSDITTWAEGHEYTVHRVQRKRKWPLGEPTHSWVQPARPDDQEPWVNLLLVPSERMATMEHG